MNSWRRIKSAVRAAQAAIASEPKHLASIAPLVEDALALLDSSPSKESIEEIKYLLTRTQEFVAKWRPSGKSSSGVFYIQPGWAKSTDEQTGEALSLLEEFVNKDYIEEITISEVTETMKVFISHSSSDTAVAEALVELIHSALNIRAKDIRCTSVGGYRLPAGADTNKQLRSEVFECQAFIALLSPASMASVYVLFELGARWGSENYLVPIMIKDTKVSDLKAPLSAIHAISGKSETDLHQLIDDLSQRLELPPEKPAVYNKALRSFIDSVKPK